MSTRAKTESKRVKKSAMSGQFVVQKRDSAVFINGNQVLVPAGKSSIGRKKITAAVEKVVSKRKSA